MEIFESAYAKVNYRLTVGDTRADGYHDIETVMDTVSLCDDVTVRISPGDGITLTVGGDDTVPTDGRNIAYRAAEAFYCACGKSYHTEIHIVKRIPSGGGLAGGSSDGAAVLRALNRLSEKSLDEERLCRIAAEIGSDIPYCVRGGLAVCTGRGEIVKPYRTQTPLWFLIAATGEQVSTKDAYARIDKSERRSLHGSSDECVRAILTGDVPRLAEQMFNSFEDSVLPTIPKAREYLSAFKRYSSASAMSGSGSTVFSVFGTEEEARRVMALLSFPTILANRVQP